MSTNIITCVLIDLGFGFCNHIPAPLQPLRIQFGSIAATLSHAYFNYSSIDIAITWWRLCSCCEIINTRLIRLIPDCPAYMQWQKGVSYSALANRAQKNGHEKRASNTGDFVLLAQSTSSVLHRLDAVRLWAATLYAYTLMRLVARSLGAKRKLAHGGGMTIKYGGCSTMNALAEAVKEIMAILYVRNVWSDYYRSMRKLNFHAPDTDTLEPWFVFWKAVLRLHLHDIRKPYLHELLEHPQKKPRLGLVMHAPRDPMWAALLKTLHDLNLKPQVCALSEIMRRGILMLFVVLTTRTRSKVLIESTACMPEWNQPSFLELAVEKKASEISAYLWRLHKDTWKQEIKVKDYSQNTCSIRQGQKRWIFAGITSERVERLMGESGVPLTTAVTGSWARGLPCTGPFITQHYNLNLYQLSQDRSIDGLCDVELSPLAKNAISLQNTSKSCCRFCAQPSNHIPQSSTDTSGVLTVGTGDDDEASDVSDDVDVSEEDYEANDDNGPGDNHDDSDAKRTDRQGKAFQWTNFLNIQFQPFHRADLVKHYNALDEELKRYRLLTDIWSFTFCDGVGSVDVALCGAEMRALDIDNVLCNNCMLEKVIVEVTTAPQTFGATKVAL